MKTRLVLLTALLCAAGCRAVPAGPVTLAQLPDIDTKQALADITQLASDAFEGRAPGSPGEVRTVDYLTRQFAAAGLQPGSPDGRWTQTVPLVGLTPERQTPLVVVDARGKRRTFAVGDEVVAFSRRVADLVDLSNSELVFVGYGVQAPEYQWDDIKGMDLHGKTLVVLVNDPQVPAPGGEGALDESVFRGKAMTYYGRWTYKFDKAAELGADAVLLVHETATAGYPFTVVQGFGGERFDLQTPDRNLGKARVEAWISVEAAQALFAMAGLDYGAQKQAAASRSFHPVPLHLKASMRWHQAQRTVQSRNVIGRLPGADPVLKDEYVIYTAHWDHFGIGQPVDGDAIYNGAQDNASGVAGMLAIARAARRVTPAPKRTLLFLAVTAEEQGLLGSQYYGTFPLYPLARTAANINVDDNLSLIGRTKDLLVVGFGASDLDDYVLAAAAEQGRSVRPDGEPEKGYYYRSDHFNFAKVGVPALEVDAGSDVIGRPQGWGQQQKDHFTGTIYHSPADQVRADWDLSGYAEDAKLLLAVGYRVAQAATMPNWKPGNEFRTVRDASLRAR